MMKRQTQVLPENCFNRSQKNVHKELIKLAIDDAKSSQIFKAYNLQS